MNVVKDALWSLASALVAAVVTVVLLGQRVRRG